MHPHVPTRPSAADEAFFEGGWSDEDDRIDVYALFVLDDTISVAEVEDVLQRNYTDAGHAGFWLADDYHNLADYPDIGLDERIEHGTDIPLDVNWQSPFVGKTVEDAAEYLRSVPKPRKPLCKRWFAVLDAKLYREEDQVLICKIREDGRVELMPCVAAFVTIHFDGYDRGYWDLNLESWQNDGGGVLMSGPCGREAVKLPMDATLSEALRCKKRPIAGRSDHRPDIPSRRQVTASISAHAQSRGQ